jgi:hypothetical protein
MLYFFARFRDRYAFQKEASAGPSGLYSNATNYRTFRLIVPVPALAKIRDTVAGWTLKSLAASAAVFVPLDTIETISSC